MSEGAEFDAWQCFRDSGGQMAKGDPHRRYAVFGEGVPPLRCFSPSGSGPAPSTLAGATRSEVPGTTWAMDTSNVVYGPKTIEPRKGVPVTQHIVGNTSQPQKDRSSIRNRPTLCDTQVSTSQFEAGQLPPICANTGLPADGWTTTHAKSKIGAQWLLLLAGFVPFLIVRALTIKRSVGYLPVNRQASDELVRNLEEGNRSTASALRRRVIPIAAVFTGVGVVVALSLSYLDSRRLDENPGNKSVAELQAVWDDASRLAPFTESRSGAEWSTNWTRYSEECLNSQYLYRNEESNTLVCRPEESIGVTFDADLKLSIPNDAMLFLDKSVRSDYGSGTLASGYVGRTINLAPAFYVLVGVPLLALIVHSLLLSRRRVRLPTSRHVALDRSGMLLTVSDVHPSFAAAAQHGASLPPRPF